MADEFIWNDRTLPVTYYTPTLKEWKISNASLKFSYKYIIHGEVCVHRYARSKWGGIVIQEAEMLFAF